MPTPTEPVPGPLFSTDLCDPRPLYELLRRELSAAAIVLEVSSPAEGLDLRVTVPPGSAIPEAGLLRARCSGGAAVGEGEIALSIAPSNGGFPADALERWERLRPFIELLLRQFCELGHERVEKRILSEACERSASAVLVFDGRDQIVYANGPADELLSRQTEELLAVSLTDDSPVRLVQFVLETLAGDLAGRRRPTLSPDGARTVLLTDGTRFDLSIAPLGGRPEHRLVVLRQMRRFEMTRARPGLREAGLSDREIEVVDLLLLGLRNAEIADRLKLSSYTVKDHLKHVFHKLNIRSRSELVSRVLQLSG